MALDDTGWERPRAPPAAPEPALPGASPPTTYFPPPAPAPPPASPQVNVPAGTGRGLQVCELPTWASPKLQEPGHKQLLAEAGGPPAGGPPYAHPQSPRSSWILRARQAALGFSLEATEPGACRRRCQVTERNGRESQASGQRTQGRAEKEEKAVWKPTRDPEKQVISSPGTRRWEGRVLLETNESWRPGRQPPATLGSFC